MKLRLSILFILCMGLFLYAQVRPDTDHDISLQEARDLIQNHQLIEGKDVRISEFFGRDAIQKILDQYDCVGIRIYYGQESDGTPVLVLMGVESQGKDLEMGPRLEKGLPCPPYCP